MNSWARKSIKVGVLSAGFLLAGTAAHAADTTTNNAGIGNGNQIDAGVQAPIDVCGNAIALFGNAYAGCGGAWANPTSVGDPHSSNNSGLLNGARARAFLQAPIDVCGNGVGIGGTASAWCAGGSWTAHKPGGHQGKPGGGYYTMRESARVEAHGGGPSSARSHNSGLLNGARVLAPIQVPINFCGNAIGLLGDAAAGCAGGADASIGEGGLLSAWNGVNSGVGNGTQLLPIIQIPINVCGNAVGALGDANASCRSGSGAVIGDPGPAPTPYAKPLANKPSGHKGKVSGLTGGLTGGLLGGGLLG